MVLLLRLLGCMPELLGGVVSGAVAPELRGELLRVPDDARGACTLFIPALRAPEAPVPRPRLVGLLLEMLGVVQRAFARQAPPSIASTRLCVGRQDALAIRGVHVLRILVAATHGGSRCKEKTHASLRRNSESQNDYTTYMPTTPRSLAWDLPETSSEGTDTKYVRKHHHIGQRPPRKWYVGDIITFAYVHSADRLSCWRKACVRILADSLRTYLCMALGTWGA